jgi:hypothetical protein
MEEIDIGEDRLTGIEAIAKFRKEPKRRTTYLLETGQLPAGKEGRIWIASKRRLREHYEQLTAGNGAGKAA